MALIYLARHGQDFDNLNGLLNGRRDTPLTSLGREQALSLAEKVVQLRLDIHYIYTSPLRRAVETGTAVRRKLGLPADRQLTHPKLIERDFGMLTGQPKTEILKRGRGFIETEHTTFFLEAELAEDFPSVFKRAEEALNDIESKHRHHNVLMVCHGDIGNMVRAVFYGMDWQTALENHSRFMNCDLFELSPRTFGGCLL